MELQFDISEGNKEKEDVLPPPGPDIEIRTMAEDVEMIKKSGGDLANAQSQTGFSAERMVQNALPEPIFSEESEGAGPSHKKLIILIAGIFIAAIIIGFLSYYLASRMF